MATAPTEPRVEEFDGVPMTVVAPTGAPRGGVAVLTDGGGAGPHFIDVAGRFAALGYVGVVPHLYHRSGVSFVDTGRAEDSEPLREAFTPETLLADMDACFGYFSTRGLAAAQMAIVGFCMGGSIGFYTAVHRKFGAAVTFYGAGIAEPRYSMPTQLDLVADLQTPWLGLYADLDPALPPAVVDEMRVRVAGAKVPTEVVRYAEAGHAFLRPTPHTHHAPSAEDAWRRTCDWLERYLAG